MRRFLLAALLASALGAVMPGVAVAQSASLGSPVSFAVMTDVNLARTTVLPITLMRISDPRQPDATKGPYVLHTSIGSFAPDKVQDTVEVVFVGKAETVTVCLYLGEVAEVPDVSQRLWLTSMDKEVARTTLVLRQQARISIVRSPVTAPTSARLIGALRVNVLDQYGEGLYDVPVLLRYRLPGGKPMAVAASTDADGMVAFDLPPSDTAGTGYFQVSSTQSMSQQVAVTYVAGENAGTNLPTATVSLPADIRSDVDAEIPILIALTGGAGTAVPNKVLLVTKHSALDFAESGEHFLELPLADGIGKATLRFLGRVPPIPGGMEWLEVYLPTEKRYEALPERCLSRVDLHLREARTCMCHIQPDNPAKLFVSDLDKAGLAVKGTRAMLRYRDATRGECLIPSQNDRYGNTFFPLPAARVSDIEQFFLYLPEGRVRYVFVSYDKHGRIEAWGHWIRDGELDWEERFTYDDKGALEKVSRKAADGA